MSKEAELAKLKSAAYALVALVGANEAERLVQSVAREIGDAHWNGSGPASGGYRG